MKQAKTESSLTISQRQAVIKIFEKKDRQKCIKNWRPISLLNVDTKIIYKTFAAKLEPIGPSTVSSNQTVFVENIPGYLVTINLEKAFDSLDHDFLICDLKKFGFGDFWCFIAL